MKRIVNISVQVCFVLFVVALVIATVFIDKNIDSSFPNTVKYANAIYYILAGIVFIIPCLLKKVLIGARDISSRMFFWGGGNDHRRFCLMAV